MGVILVAVQALKRLPREQVQVATKFGMRPGAGGTTGVCGQPEYVRASCEASLRRLDVDYIDLYYQHRVDTTIPIEDTVRTPVVISSHGLVLRDENRIIPNPVLKAGAADRRAEEAGGGREGQIHRAIGGQPGHHQACSRRASRLRGADGVVSLGSRHRARHRAALQVEYISTLLYFPPKILDCSNLGPRS
jgi:hypothetical protein